MGRLPTPPMTYSIAAYDPITRAAGVAVASCVPAVGAAVPFANLDGAVATQSRFNYALGHDGVTALGLGMRVGDALSALLRADPAPQLRQVHGVDRHGGYFAHTGSDVKDWKGSRGRAHLSIAGNTLTGPEVLEAMEAAYLDAADVEFSERLLLALAAGEASGGDRRGRQSAALLIVAPDVEFHHNLRVDDHPDPVRELQRLHSVARQAGAERSQRPRHVPLLLKR